MTNINHNKGQHVMISGQYEDYKEINIGKYKFADSDRSRVGLGEVYEEPMIEIPGLKLNQRNAQYNQTRSQSNLISERVHGSGRKAMITSKNNYGNNDSAMSSHYNQYIGGLNPRSNLDPSEGTVAVGVNIADQSQNNRIGLSEIDDATEFTE